MLLTIIRDCLLVMLPCALALAYSNSAGAAEVNRDVDGVDAYFDLPYYSGDDADPSKHKLDLIVPRVGRDFPTVIFIHGGMWIMGDKRDFGVYTAIGRMLAQRGIGCAVINYRLSPLVKHPEHIKDVARAFDWVNKNIAQYRGRPDQLFLCGHSAGGHLAALLATDESHLKTVGHAIKDVRGVVAISGVYNIPANMFKEIFGEGPELHRAASPVTHVQAGCPPFLIVYADRDFPFCDRISQEFCQALKTKQVPAELLVVKPRNHIDIIAKCAGGDDECARALVGFVLGHLAK
jgi:acetyl esterase/lipase